MIKVNLKNKYFITLIVLVLLSVSVNIIQAVYAATAAPGSTGDPIVAKSYVDTNDKKATALITTLQTNYSKAQKDITALNGQVAALKTQVAALKSTVFTAISVEAGKKITFGSGTEIILRSGNATAVAGTGGGLSDVTSAKDIISGATVFTNHLLISSRDDGRGMNCITKCYLIVRGSYKI
jgi:hypothetical protein